MYITFEKRQWFWSYNYHVNKNGKSYIVSLCMNLHRYCARQYHDAKHAVYIRYINESHRADHCTDIHRAQLSYTVQFSQSKCMV